MGDIVKPKRLLLTIATLVLAFSFGRASTARAEDPLPSWNDGEARKSITGLRREGHEGGLAGFRARAGEDRHLRQRRHPLG